MVRMRHGQKLDDVWENSWIIPSPWGMGTINPLSQGYQYTHKFCLDYHYGMDDHKWYIMQLDTQIVIALLSSSISLLIHPGIPILYLLLSVLLMVKSC